VKRKLVLCGSLLGLAALVVAGYAPAPIVHAFMAGEAVATSPASEGGGFITVLNPAISGKMAERFPLVPRLSTLEGKTLYLIDIQWGGPEAAYSVYEEMQAWFAKNMPSVKVVLRRTTDNMVADDPGLRKELIEKKADAALVGIAG